MDEISDNATGDFKITDIITGITTCAFILGAIDPMVYYGFFYFNVFDYIELSEIATHIIQYEIIIIFPFSVGILLFRYFYFERVRMKRLDENQRIPKGLIILAVISYMGLFTGFFITDIISLPLFLVFSLALLFAVTANWFIFSKLNFTFDKLFGRGINIFNRMFLLVLSVNIILGLSFSLVKVDSVKFKHLSKGTYIVREKDTIKSTSVYYYIGKTNKFVFFYDAKEKVVDAYPESTIKKYSLK
ncbi:hypothetical protein BH09BAC6_BH09BAC6_10860 [soil metagenome]|jgi:hypothetical protein